MPEDENDDLILWMLSLSPTQRLEVVQEFIDSVWETREEREKEYRPEDWETRPLPRDVMWSKRRLKHPKGVQFE